MMTRDILSFDNFYLVGIKGVAMSSLASCLSDVGKSVRGSDVANQFVTKNILDSLGINQVDELGQSLPSNIDCLVYTSAHGASTNPQVVEATNKGLAVFTQAEAIASLANRHQTTAVCGVGGKSTISAMITWILEKTGQQPSYSVGVGEIIGLSRNGAYRPESEHFIVEADEYVSDPIKAKQGQHLPRFSFLEPDMVVVSQIRFDHPDVYRDLEHTKQVYWDFLKKLPAKSALIVNGDDPLTLELTSQVADQHDLRLISYGTNTHCDWQLGEIKTGDQRISATIKVEHEKYELALALPGKYNLMNGLSALAASAHLGVEPSVAVKALSTFASTKRRAEYLGQRDGVDYYDDYAHHPSELFAITRAFAQWLPNRRLVFAFEPHTYSRTKALLSDFVKVLSEVKELIILDIFASAREARDDSISAKLLVVKINEERSRDPHLSSLPPVRHLADREALADFCLNELKSGDTMITLGAGDIYLVADKLKLIK